MSLSAIVITRNEQANIAACLDSLAFADQLVVIDHQSSDATAGLARERGAEVKVVDDWPGFGPQKNRALDCARGDWVLSIDADERVDSKLAAEIQRAMASDTGCVAYEIPRLTSFCGQWIRHAGWTPDRVLRLFRRGHARFSDDSVHERVVTIGNGRVGRLKEPLLHHSYPTPESYWRKLQQYSHAWALQQHRLGRRASIGRAAASGVVAFVRSYVLRLGFLDGAMGFVVCTYQAQAAFGKYFELNYLNRQDAGRQV